MKKYKFYCDQKGIIWERTYFTIEADNKKEAKRQARNYVENCEDVDYREYVSETFEEMTPEQNEGCSTYEVWTEDNNIVCKNGKW